MKNDISDSEMQFLMDSNICFYAMLLIISCFIKGGLISNSDFSILSLMVQCGSDS
jgi:hypothetical protein